LTIRREKMRGVKKKEGTSNVAETNALRREKKGRGSLIDI